MIDRTTFEERKRRYIESVEAENIPAEKTYWQYPAPSYYHTRDYAAQFPEAINTNETVTFKRTKKDGMILVVILIVASLLIYIIGEKRFGFGQLLLIAILLLVVLPLLLNNKPAMMISHQSICLYKEDKNIFWKYVLLTYIKEVHQEKPDYFFIVHYYDESDDQIKKMEIGLDGLVSPATLAATVEKFRQSNINNE